MHGAKPQSAALRQEPLARRLEDYELFPPIMQPRSWVGEPPVQPWPPLPRTRQLEELVGRFEVAARASDAVELSYVPAGERDERRVSLMQAAMEPLRAAEPVRRIASYPTQKRHPSLYWCSKTGRHLVCESRNEERHLRVIDFDDSVRWVVAQPFWLHFRHGERWSQHAPDFLVERGAGALEIVDATIPGRYPDGLPESYRATAWACDRMGWGYRVVCAVDPVFAASLSLIAAGKRPIFGEEQFGPGVLERAGTGTPWGVVEEAFGKRNRSTVRAVLLRLLWLGKLTCDLSWPIETWTLVGCPAEEAHV
jgi:hypothetical protein